MGIKIKGIAYTPALSPPPRKARRGSFWTTTTCTTTGFSERHFSGISLPGFSSLPLLGKRGGDFLQDNHGDGRRPPTEGTARFGHSSFLHLLGKRGGDDLRQDTNKQACTINKHNISGRRLFIHKKKS